MRTKPFFFILSYLVTVFALPLMAFSDCCCRTDDSWDIAAEARVAYYHPSSKRVRRIYSNGWADYQLEISTGFKGFGFLSDSCGNSDFGWRIWAGVSGFSKKGHSTYFHDRTRLELIPVSFGLKLTYDIFCNTKIFIGGAACYSFLRIKDHSDYVRKHTHKEDWGGLLQTGINYTFCDWLILCAFFDYYFQRFHFHDKCRHTCSSYGYYKGGRFIDRNDLNMDGYKVGCGIGVTF